MIAINKLKKPQSEEEIKSYWKYTDKIYTSCICITYNQEIYIKDAIDSMLAQQTEYRFEIIIHDDLSTDKTREIILDYKENYPTIINLILQEENQYSKGKRIIPLAVKESSSEFLAICEGDDYWIDKNKLQKQILTLLKNNNISLCIHKAYKDDNGCYTEWDEIDHGKKERVLSINDVILSTSQFAPTASYFMRKEVIESLPSWADQAPVGDFLIEVYSKKVGAIIYMPDTMSVYRFFALGSWSINELADLNKKIKLNEKMIQVYDYIKLDDIHVPADLFARREKYAYITNIKISFLLKNKEEIKNSLDRYMSYRNYSRATIYVVKLLTANFIFTSMIDFFRNAKNKNKNKK